MRVEFLSSGPGVAASSASMALGQASVNFHHRSTRFARLAVRFSVEVGRPEDALYRALGLLRWTSVRNSTSDLSARTGQRKTVAMNPPGLRGPTCSTVAFHVCQNYAHESRSVDCEPFTLVIASSE